MERVLMLRASKYDFAPEGGGKNIVGAKVVILNPEKSASGDNKGLNVITMKTDVFVYETLQYVPGWYDVEYNIIPTSKGANIEVSEAKFIANVKFAEEKSK